MSDQSEQLERDARRTRAQLSGTVEELRARIARGGSIVGNEGETTCCYANSDKTWVADGQGVAWEAFYTASTANTYYGEKSSGCCLASVAD